MKFLPVKSITNFLFLFVQGYCITLFSATYSSGQVLKWVKKDTTSFIPFQAGFEGNPLYVCQAEYAGELHPGKIVSGQCDIAYEGREIPIADYKILSGAGVWMKYTGDLTDAFVAGNSRDNLKYHLCRAYFRGIHPGKIVNGKCSISYGGIEKIFSDFEVLKKVSN